MGGSCSSVVKVLSLMTSGLSIELMVIFIVLKVDGKTAVANWGWGTILIIPLAVAAVCLATWLAFRFYVDLAQQQDVEDLNARDFLKDRSRVNVYTIESFAEASVFRHSMLFVAYVFLLIYAALAARTPCSGCSMPYTFITIGASCCYAVRLGLLCYSLTRYYAHYRVMTKELFKYQHEFDKIGESRMFNDVVPDLYWPTYWEWGVLIDAGVVIVTVGFAVMLTIWTHNKECALTCPVKFHNCSYLLYGMWTIEGLYVITAGLIRFFKRSSGVESLQDLFNSLRNKNLRAAMALEQAASSSGRMRSRDPSAVKVQKLRS